MLEDACVMLMTSHILSRVRKFLPASRWLPDMLVRLSGMVLNKIFVHVLLVDSYGIVKHSIREHILGATYRSPNRLYCSLLFGQRLHWLLAFVVLMKYIAICNLLFFFKS